MFSLFVLLKVCLWFTVESDSGLHLAHVHSQPFEGELKTGEFCDTELFTGECPEGKVILISMARYGRMKVGRCVEFHLGYINCFTDVTTRMDSRCSGRQKCQVRVPDAEFEITRPCLKELKNYLELSFTCLQVTRLVTHSCTKHEANVTSQSGYILPVPLSRDLIKCQVRPTVIRIVAQPGQHVLLSLYDLSIHENSRKLGKSRWNKEPCGEVFGWYKEKNSSSPFENDDDVEDDDGVDEEEDDDDDDGDDDNDAGGKIICSSGARISTVVRTKKHVLVLWFRERKLDLTPSPWGSEFNVTSPTPFIVRYSVHGCPDIDLTNPMYKLSPRSSPSSSSSSSPSSTSSSSSPLLSSSSSSSSTPVYFYEATSDKDKLKVGCEKGEWKWVLRCSATSNTWIGQVGNCSKQLKGPDNQKTWRNPGEDVLLSYGVAIAAGGILGVVIALLIIIIISCNRSRRQPQVRGPEKDPPPRLVADYSKVSNCSCLISGGSLNRFVPKTSLENKTFLAKNTCLTSVSFTLVNESKEPLLHDRNTRYADLFPASQEQVYYGSSQQPHYHHHHHHHHGRRRHHLDGSLPDECPCASSVPLPVSSLPGSTWKGGSMELDVISKMPQQTKQFEPENC